MRTDGRGILANDRPPHGRHRPSFQQSARLRHGDAPYRACDGEADPKRFQPTGILEEYHRHGDRYGDYGGCAPGADHPLGGGLSSVRGGLDLGDGLLFVRPELHGSRLWRHPAVRAVAVTRPPRGHQRPPVLWTVNGRVVRDHEPVDRQAPTVRNRVQSEAAGNRAPLLVAGDGGSS